MAKYTESLFVSDEELEIFELTKVGLDHNMEEFLKEKKAISLGFARQFNLNLVLGDKAAAPLIHFISTAITSNKGKAVRKPTKRQLICLFANLYRHHCIHPEMWTRVNRRNQTAMPKVNNPSGIVWKTLAGITDALVGLGYIDLVKGTFDRSNKNKKQKNKRSRIRATVKLIELFENHFKLSFKDIGFHPNSEPIVMKGPKQKDKTKPLIKYWDTPRTIDDRKLIRAYNKFIQEQEVIFPWSPSRFIPDLIYTTRVFSNGSWDEGGRLFGGEFQNLPKENRSKITINSQPVCEIDISSCHAVMAFAEVGIDWFAANNCDLYEFNKAGDWPRDVVKRAFSIMLNVDNEKSAIKALVREATDEHWSHSCKQVDRPGWYHHLIADMKKAYPEIAANFCKARGMHYMRQEGEIALMVIQDCLNCSIPVLTLHDSYIASREHSNFIQQSVSRAFKLLVGVNCHLK